MIAIRIKAGEHIGIGHLVRMSYLADALHERGREVLFVLDGYREELTPYIAGHHACYFPEGCEVPTEREDADLTLEVLAAYEIEWVVVDSYELGLEWEQRIRQGGYRLMAVDDVAREHSCDMLCDARWAGVPGTFSRYEQLVPETCEKLLGPKYCILNPEYAKGGRTPPERTTLMFSLGGGGDLALLHPLIENLLQSVEEPVRFLVVIGPLSRNAEMIRKLQEGDDRVEIIQGATSLCEYYRKTSLFVGALGTSLYELAALKVPALTFSLAENQDNDTGALEDLGHYLHLSRAEFECSEKVGVLIQTLLKSLGRLERLRQSPRLEVDANGAGRIADRLCGMAAEAASYDLKDAECERTWLSSTVSVRAVDDADINHYLASRNLPQNRQNMMVDTQIPRVEHYNWWFQNKRNSYLMEKSGQKALYIWDQPVSYNGSAFLIGGWFVCSEETSFDLAAAALQWQLDMTAVKYPEATWIAIIKKSNRYVNGLNAYMGFRPVQKSEVAFEAIRTYFNNPSPDEYNYVQKSL